MGSGSIPLHLKLGTDGYCCSKQGTSLYGLNQIHTILHSKREAEYYVKSTETHIGKMQGDTFSRIATTYKTTGTKNLGSMKKR